MLELIKILNTKGDVKDMPCSECIPCSCTNETTRASVSNTTSEAYFDLPPGPGIGDMR